MVEEKKEKTAAKKKAPEEKEPAKAKKEEEPEKEKKEKKAEVKEKPPKKEEEKPEPEKAEAAGPKNKKINKMTLAEVEAKLEGVKSTMGGLNSKYARQLILRKEYLKSLK
jgi:hypothetical protein